MASGESIGHDQPLPEPTEVSPLLASKGDINSHTSSAVASSTGSANATAFGDDDDNVNEAINDVTAGQADTLEDADVSKVAHKLPVLLPALAIGIFLSALDQTLIVATYAKMSSDLHALNRTSWISTAYFLTLTCCQPLYGKLSDIFGRKECLLFAYVFFGLGSLGCGLAGDISQLIASRAVAGIGGGGINAVVSILLTDLVPLRDRGLWQGYLNIVFSAGTAVGAPVGGLVADSLGWRWSFFAQVPLVAIAWIAVYFILQLPKLEASHWLEKLGKVDFTGAVFLVSAVLCLLLGLDNGSNVGWDNLYSIVPLSISPVLLAIFVLVEIKVASHPFAPGHVIFDRSLCAAYFTNFFIFFGQFTVLFYLPLLYQAVNGSSAVKSGLLLLPISIFGVSSSLLSGFIMKRTGHYYKLTVTSTGILVLGVVPLVLFAGAWFNSTVGTSIALAMVAIGTGSTVTSTLIALISNASKEDMAVVVACSYLFRSLGSALGVSIGAAVLQLVLRSQLEERLGSGEEAGDIVQHVRESLDYIKQLEPSTADIVRHCYQVAVIHVFGLQAIPFGLAFVSSLFIKEKSLGK